MVMCCSYVVSFVFCLWCCALLFFFCLLTLFHFFCCHFFFFKQKTAYEMRISDWSSDVCSSDLFRTCRASTARDHAPVRAPWLAHREGSWPRVRSGRRSASVQRRHCGSSSRSACGRSRCSGAGLDPGTADRKSSG